MKYFSLTQTHMCHIVVSSTYWPNNLHQLLTNTNICLKHSSKYKHNHKYTNSSLKYKLPTNHNHKCSQHMESWLITSLPNLCQRLRVVESKVSLKCSRQKFLVVSYSSPYLIFVTPSQPLIVRKRTNIRYFFRPIILNSRLRSCQSWRNPQQQISRRGKYPPQAEGVPMVVVAKKVLKKYIHKGPKLQNLVIVTMWHKLNQD